MMVQGQFLLTSLFAVATLSTGSSARDCYVNGYRGSSWLEVKTPQQLYQFEGCTTIFGSLNIFHSWAGSFSLRGVKNITGVLGVSGEVSGSIDLPDLEYAEKVFLFEQYPVERLLLPRLKHVEKLFMYQPKGFSFDLGALQSAGEIRMHGPWSKVSFPSLEKVDGRLSFETQWFGNGTPYRDTAPVDIELPVLRQVGELILTGDITSLSIPSLEVVGNGGLTVEAQQATLPDLSLPSLKSLETLLSIWGYIGRVDLGPLEKTKAPMYINTYIPVQVSSKLYEAGKINIGGEIKTLNFSRLLTADSMAIRSNIPTECSDHVVWTYRYLNRPREAEFCDEQSLIRAGWNTWPDLNRPTPGSEPTPTPTPTPYSYTPTPSPSPSPGASPRPGISSGAEIAIVAVFGVIFSLSIVSFCMSRGERIKIEEDFEEDRGPPLSKVELEAADKEEMDRLLHGEFADDDFDAPPPYAKHVRG